jgi:hypothetical protein
MRVIIVRIESVTANSSWFAGKGETIQERAVEKVGRRHQSVSSPLAASANGLSRYWVLGTGYSVLGTLKSEEFPQSLGLRTADWNLALLLIIHAQLVRTLEPGHNLANAVDIHQVGAVGAPEQSGI